MTQVTESEYCLAKEDPRLRQEFIEAIDLIGTVKIDKIAYSSKDVFIADYSSPKDKAKLLMSMNSYLVGPSFKLGEQRLFIFDRAFQEPFINFMSMFLYHELHHARQYKSKSCRRFCGDFLTRKNPDYSIYQSAVVELPAYLNQFKVRGEFSIKDYTEYKDMINKLEAQIKKQAKQLGRDWKRDLSQVLCPSPYDDVVREVYGID